MLRVVVLLRIDLNSGGLGRVGRSVSHIASSVGWGERFQRGARLDLVQCVHPSGARIDPARVSLLALLSQSSINQAVSAMSSYRCCRGLGLMGPGSTCVYKQTGQGRPVFFIRALVEAGVSRTHPLYQPHVRYPLHTLHLMRFAASTSHVFRRLMCGEAHEMCCRGLGPMGRRSWRQ